MDLQRFGEKIQKNLAQRKIELSRLRILALSTHPDRAQESLLCRAVVVFSYAHWEGFVKSSSQLYIEHLNTLQIPVLKLKKPLQAAHVLTYLSQAGNSSRTSVLGELLEKIDTDRKEPFFANPAKCIATGGNLSSEAFKDIVIGIGLPYSDAYSTRQAFIDEKLVHSRNQVVHGEMIPFTQADAGERLDAVRTLLDMYANQLLDAARDGLYLMTETSQPSAPHR
ncbi:MAE_28990/MAE_18760 family HEPN-like nuclease [Streptacidiphilus cavernicola]|uniref:MAE_28990/MAE_18760 family HEPN-like nuclease n=1 Tax=Streptacidiphilus cavernicola TaxID=3342716 RepID=A0ABV6VSF1_9ACTN